jgi:recombination protein RecT
MADQDNTTQRNSLVPAKKSSPKTVGELLTREDETRHRLSAVAGKFLPAERAMRLAIMAVRKTPLLAQCDPTSFMGALMSATGLGVEPNTAKQHAFLIPYKQSRPKRDQNGVVMKDGNGKWLWESYHECQFQMGYRGFVALMYRSSLVIDVTAESIREGDSFKHGKGTRTFLEYEKALSDRGELIGSFCYTRLREDGQAFTVLPADEIYKLRGRSQTWKTLADAVEEQRSEARPNPKKLEAAERKFAETPWEMWPDAMWAKSAIRQHAKQQELSGEEDAPRITVAADLDALGESGAYDIRQMADPEMAKEIIEGGELVTDNLTETDEDEAETGEAAKPQQGQQQQGAAQQQGAPAQQQPQEQVNAPRRGRPPGAGKAAAQAPQDNAALRAQFETEGKGARDGAESSGEGPGEAEGSEGGNDAPEPEQDAQRSPPAQSQPVRQQQQPATTQKRGAMLDFDS